MYLKKKLRKKTPNKDQIVNKIKYKANLIFFKKNIRTKMKNYERLHYTMKSLTIKKMLWTIYIKFHSIVFYTI